MVYVQRDGGGKVVGVYNELQPGIAEEELDKGDPGVTAFRNRKPARGAPPPPGPGDRLDTDEYLQAIVEEIATLHSVPPATLKQSIRQRISP